MSATLDERCASIQPGGEFCDAIIMGEIMYELASKDSRRILETFRAAFKKQSAARIKRGMWIGPEALEKLHSGFRLTHYYDHPDPKLFDVCFDEIEVNT